MDNLYDVLIIGGGVTGTAAARLLSKYRLKVCLLEKEPDIACGSTKANSAIVHGGYAEAHAKLKGRLCYKGRQQFAQLDRELHFGFAPIGSFVLAFEEEQRAGLVSLLENGRKNGLPDLELLDGAQVAALEPNVNPNVKYGLYCKGAGVCSPFELAVALMENAAKNGVELHVDTAASSIRKQNGIFTVKTTGGPLFHTRYIVNAAGLYAADIAGMVKPNPFSIHPRSGEYLLMQQGTGSLVNRVLFQMPTKMGKGILVTPTVYGNLLIGPDAIDEQINDRNTHAGRLYHIYKQAQRTTDKLDITKFLRSFAGVRAVADTDDFIIGKGDIPGFVNAAGIQSPGVTSSPAIAELIRDTLADSGLELVEKPDFDPARAPLYTPRPALDAKELKARVELDEGSEGRVLCRCEQVRESSVTDALGRGLPIRTVDAIKRRTRAGMGMCQGAFCRPRVASLVSHRAGQPIDSRTDVERDGLSRVSKKEMLDFFRETEQSKP